MPDLDLMLREVELAEGSVKRAKASLVPLNALKQTESYLLGILNATAASLAFARIEIANMKQQKEKDKAKRADET